MVLKKKITSDKPNEPAKEEGISSQADQPAVASEPQSPNNSSDILLDSTPITGDSQNQEETGQTQGPSEKNSFFEDGENSQSSVAPLKKIFLIFGIIFIFLSVVTAASYLSYQRGIEVGKQIAQKNLKSQMANKTTPTNTPTPTEEDIDLSEYSIKVLNGSERNGEASKLKSVLEDEGYSVSSIGNADKTYSKTTIQVKDSVSKAWVEKLKKTLSKSYILADISTLKDEDTDVVINIGSLEKEE